VRGNPVCQLCTRLRIHSASRLYIFPRLRTAELARLSASLLIATDDNDFRSRAHGPSRMSLFLGRHKTTIDLGASRYFVRSKGIPSSKKSSGLGQSGVHDSLPLLCCSLLHIELQFFPVRIDHCVNVVISLRAVQAECQAVRVVGQIDRGADAVPGNILPPEPAPAQRGMISSERNHLLEELENV